MKLKLILILFNVIAVILVLCFPTTGVAETINPATIDASGPALTPARNSLLDAISAKKCSIIDWDANGRIIEPVPGRIPSDDDKIHSFDRPKDFEGTYVLQDLVEQLSSTSELETKIYNSFTGTYGTQYYPVTKKMKFADQKVINEAKALGYLRNVRSILRRNGQDQKIPAWETTYLLPTSCGTFLFVKYKARCITNNRMVVLGDADLYQVIQKDESIPNDPGRTFSDAYVLTDFYQPIVTSDAIAGEIYDRYWEVFYNKVTLVLQSAQTALELIPFGSSVSAVVKMVEARLGWIDEISTADKWGMRSDIILDAMPFIAQLQKARKYSKQIFVIGSGAILATQIARQASLDTWRPELQDVLRLVVYSVTGFQMRVFSIKWNSVTKMFEKNLDVNDGHKGFKEVGATNQAGVTAAVNQVNIAPIANAPDFNKVKLLVKGVVDRFQTRRNIAVVDEEDVLVDALKIKGTPAETIFRDRRRLIKQIYDKLYAQMDISGADNALNTLGTHLHNAGKHLKPVNLTLDEDEWTLILKARDYASTQMTSQFVIRPDLHPEEWYKRLKIHFLRALQGDVNSIGSLPFSKLIGHKVKPKIGPSYHPGTQDITYGVFDGNCPTHFTVDANTLSRTYLFNPQPPFPPNTFPTDFSLPGINNGHARDLVQLELLDTKTEEFTHAAEHLHDTPHMQSGKTPDGHDYVVSGIGMPTQINTNDTLTAVVAVAILPKSIHTPNVNSWIQGLSLTEIKNILISRGFDFSRFDDTKLRAEVLNIFEQDVFLLAAETGGYLSKTYRNEYAVRVLVQEAIDLGIITGLPPTFTLP